MQNVVIGYLGTQLDSGQGPGRWEKWRPTVALAQQPDTLIHRMELLHPTHYTRLAEVLKSDIAQVSPETVVNLVPMDVADPWDFGEVYAALYDWSRAYAFDPLRERYWAHITTGTHVAQICMFLMVETRFIPGVLVQTAPPRRQGAGDPGKLTLIDLDLSRYDVLAQRFQHAQTEARDFLKSGIATRSPRFNALIDEIERVAVRSKAPILLTGPTGAGKSHLARRMYELKKSRHQVQGAFIEVNCATLRGDGAASTLFGHKKGAFTGAVAERAGLLRSADGGVLFLDEIGELGADEQAMLLRAIEDRRFLPVGSDREVSSNFQLIAGTNRDLRDDVAQGRFRDDLYARINLWAYTLPGLAERPEDFEPNIDYLLNKLNAETGRSVRFNVEARTHYLTFAQSAEAPWRANFRDLSASITRLVTLADGGRITTTQVEAEIARLRWLWRRLTAASDSHAAGNRRSNGSAGVALEHLLPADQLAQMDQFDQLQLASVVAVCRKAGSLSKAGRQLFDRSREGRSVINDADRLRKYLLRHQLSWETVVTTEPPWPAPHQARLSSGAAMQAAQQRARELGDEFGG